MQSRDYIGPDPVRWVERLLEVNEGSQFTGEQKAAIDYALRQLHEELRHANPPTTGVV